MFQSTEQAETLLAQAIGAQDISAFATPFSQWLHSVVPYDNITVLAYFPARAPELLLAEAKDPSVHANFEKIYLAGAFLLDPFHELHVSRAKDGVYRLADIAPDQFQRNRYFRDYYSSTSLIDELGFVQHTTPDVSVHICLGRDNSSGTRFSSRELSADQRIAPIVRVLASRHWRDFEDRSAGTEADVSTRLRESLLGAQGIALSHRQAEVAMLVLKGNSSVSIGLKLGISPQTVKVFRKQLYRKCGISSQAELFNMMLPLLGS